MGPLLLTEKSGAIARDSRRTTVRVFSRPNGVLATADVQATPLDTYCEQSSRITALDIYLNECEVVPDASSIHAENSAPVFMPRYTFYQVGVNAQKSETTVTMSVSRRFLGSAFCFFEWYSALYAAKA